MKINLNLNKSKTYVLACSFGPDSMALLDACLKEKINVVVAHVNYHHRNESDFEENSLRKYCKERNLRIYILDLKHIKPEGNFEAWARKQRYEFFTKVSDEVDACGTLVAHHQDDLIETYIMQKRRQKYVKHWGIAEKTNIFGSTIIRPLLSYTKKDLLKYCEENNVPFSIDKTNLESDYERNKIRHEIVEKLTTEQRKKYLEKIRLEPTTKIDFKSVINIEEFLKFSYQETVAFLDEFMAKKFEHRSISKPFAESLKKAMNSNKPNLEIKLTKNLSIFKYENTMHFIDKTQLQNYKIIMKKPDRISSYIFDIDFTKNTSDRNINYSDYPLTIKNLKPGDKYEINNYLKQARRLFIDWKMPLFLRGVWPGVFNKNGKLIYTPRFRVDFVDNHKSKFVINIDKLY